MHTHTPSPHARSAPSHGRPAPVATLATRITKSIATLCAAVGLAGIASGCAGMREARILASLPPVPEQDVPHAHQAPRIDGILDDTVWQHAATLPPFVPFLGSDPAEFAGVPTSVRALWRPEALYLAFDCTDSDIYVRPREGDAETSLHQGDVIEVFIDPAGEGLTWVELQVNPAGQRFDSLTVMRHGSDLIANGRISDVAIRRSRTAWVEGYTLTGIQAASGRTPHGWTVELAIPALPLLEGTKRTAFEPGELRLNLARYDWQPKPDGTDGRRLIGQLWSAVQPGCPHISPARMGRLQLVAPTGDAAESQP